MSNIITVVDSRGNEIVLNILEEKCLKFGYKEGTKVLSSIGMLSVAGVGKPFYSGAPVCAACVKSRTEDQLLFFVLGEKNRLVHWPECRCRSDFEKLGFKNMVDLYKSTTNQILELKNATVDFMASKPPAEQVQNIHNMLRDLTGVFPLSLRHQ